MRKKPSCGDCLEMAATSRKKPELNKLVFWTRPAVSSKEESIVPGVNDFGNVRPSVRGGRTKEIRAVMPVVQPKIVDLDSQSLKTSSLASTYDVPSCISAVKGDGVSLKDLCVEDKKRVANLIKELARLGEEKENAEKNLEEERKHYEEQILTLVDQQEEILKEYEEQKKLLEYQADILKHQQDPYQQQTGYQRTSPQGKVRVSQTSRPVLVVDSPSRVAVTVSRYREVGAQTDIRESGSYQDLRNVCRDAIIEDGVENCSTQALPSVSLPLELDSVKLRLQRPFTAIIDKELANQRQILAAATESMKYLPDNGAIQYLIPRHDSKTALPEVQMNEDVRVGGQHVHERNRDSGSPRRESVHRYIDQNPAVTNSQFVRGSDPWVNKSPHLGQGHACLSTEKNEVIARFMQSQAARTEHEMYTTGDRHGAMVGADHGQTDRRGPRGSKTKKRRHPPSTYGPLHAPIMSSTQKSSEFGDSLSVNSTVLVDRGKQMMRQLHAGVADGDEVAIRDENIGSGRQKNASSKNQRGIIVNLGELQDKELDKESGVQVDSRVSPHGAGRYSKDTRDGQFLNEYKQMSAVERKSQLLKQRAVLLEEQAKLKEILAGKKSQLEVENQAMVTPTNQVVAKSGKARCDEASLLKLEEECAQREQDLAKARELIARRKRQETATNRQDQKGQQQQQGVSPRPVNLSSLVAITNRVHNKGEGRTDGYDDLNQRLVSCNPDRRVEQKVSSHGSVVRGATVNEQARRSDGGGEANAACEGGDVVCSLGEKQVVGKYGDVCVVYPEGKNIVKKLDYTLHSDTESDAGDEPVFERCSTPANRDEAVQTQDLTLSSTWPRAKTVIPMTDVETSVSFAHIAMEEALSVVDIIQALSEAGSDIRWPRRTGLSRSLSNRREQDVRGIEPTTNMSRTAQQNGQAVKGKSPTQQIILADTNTNHSLARGNTSLALAERDDVLELFELKRTSRTDLDIRNGDQGHDRVTGSPGLDWQAVSSDDEDCPEKIIQTLSSCSGGDAILGPRKKGIAVSNNHMDVCQGSDGGDFVSGQFDLARRDVVDGEEGNGEEDEAENQILEEVFFVLS